MNYAYINPPALDSTTGRPLRPSERFARTSSAFLNEQHAPSSSSRNNNISRLSTAHVSATAVSPSSSSSYYYDAGQSQNRSPLSDGNLNGATSPTLSDGERTVATTSAGGLSNSYYSGTTASSSTTTHTPATSATSSPVAVRPSGKNGATFTAASSSVFRDPSYFSAAPGGSRTPSILTPPTSPPHFRSHASDTGYHSSSGGSSRRHSRLPTASTSTTITTSPASPTRGQASSSIDTRRIILPDEEESRRQLQQLRISAKEPPTTPKKLQGWTSSQIASNSSADTPLKSPSKKKSFFSFGGGKSKPQGHKRSSSLGGGSGAISETEDADPDTERDNEKRPTRSTNRSFVGNLGKRSKSVGRGSVDIQRESISGSRVQESVVRGDASGRDSSSTLGDGGGEDEWILLTQRPEAGKSNGSLNSSHVKKKDDGLPPVPTLPAAARVSTSSRSSSPSPSTTAFQNPKTPSPVKYRQPASPRSHGVAYSPEQYRSSPESARSPPSHPARRSGTPEQVRNSMLPHALSNQRTQSPARTTSPSPARNGVLDGKASPLPLPSALKNGKGPRPSSVSPNGKLATNFSMHQRHMHGSLPAPAPPKSPTTIAGQGWPAEAHVFGRAQQVIGSPVVPYHQASFGTRNTVPHYSPAGSRSGTPVPPELPQKAVTNRDSSSGNGKQGGRKAPDLLASSTRKGTIDHPRAPPERAGNRTASQDSRPDELFATASDNRQRVTELVQKSAARKSSVHSSASVSSEGSSVQWTRPCVGKPRFEEALLLHPPNILACLLDHLTYHSFRPLMQVSSALWEASHIENGEFAELVKERYLASYGYRNVPDTVSMPIRFSLRDLDAFQAGLDMSLSEYAIFAREHRQSAQDMRMVRFIRASTRAYNRLVMRLQCQPPGLPLSRPHWTRYTRRNQLAVYRPEKCAILRVWVPCESQWMSDNELVECEREVHRSGVWHLLSKGDLVRNVALSDIANEGVVIFDGKYLRDLSYVHDNIGHLPAWVNSLAFSPSHFHNQIASSTSQPIIYLDLSPFIAQIQRNLQLCKEKIDMASPSGEQYKVNRYVYRTIVNLAMGTVLTNGDSPSSRDIDVMHPDWSGQLVVETDGTTEAAKALVQRVTPVVRTIVPNGKRPPLHINNRPYRVLRNLSKPGLIFVRPVDDAQTVRQARR